MKTFILILSFFSAANLGLNAQTSSSGSGSASGSASGSTKSTPVSPVARPQNPTTVSPGPQPGAGTIGGATGGTIDANSAAAGTVGGPGNTTIGGGTQTLPLGAAGLTNRNIGGITNRFAVTNGMFFDPDADAGFANDFGQLEAILANLEASIEQALPALFVVTTGSAGPAGVTGSAAAGTARVNPTAGISAAGGIGGPVGNTPINTAATAQSGGSGTATVSPTGSGVGLRTTTIGNNATVVGQNNTAPGLSPGQSGVTPGQPQTFPPTGLPNNNPNAAGAPGIAVASTNTANAALNTVRMRTMLVALRNELQRTLPLVRNVNATLAAETGAAATTGANQPAFFTNQFGVPVNNTVLPGNRTDPSGRVLAPTGR